MREGKDALLNGDAGTNGRFIVRTLIFGSILIILNCYWIISAENRVVYELTDFSIFPTVLFTLVSVAGVNLLLKRFFKGLALSEAELALTYIMVSVATALAGHDIIRQLVPLMANPFWYATPENEWEDLFFRFIPTWLAVENRRILQGYFEGDKSAFESFWTADYLNAWLTPVLAWTALVIVLLFVMLCMNIIVRKQWIEFEKLSYPLTVMPIEVIGNTSKLFSNKFIWISFGLAFALEILAGLNFLYPVVPALKAKFIIPFTERPWNTMGWAGSGTLPVYVYPFAIGFGYLMPLDLSLSLWLFFLFWQAQDVFFNATGWTTASALQTQQRAGAWIGIGVMAVWSSRRHIMRGLRGMFTGRSADPLYPFAVVGMVLGITFVVVFWLLAGLSPWVVISYFVIYYVFCTAITRMRAELGPPDARVARCAPRSDDGMVHGNQAPWRCEFDEYHTVVVVSVRLSLSSDAPSVGRVQNRIDLQAERESLGSSDDCGVNRRGDYVYRRACRHLPQVSVSTLGCRRVRTSPKLDRISSNDGHRIDPTHDLRVCIYRYSHHLEKRVPVVALLPSGIRRERRLGDGLVVVFYFPRLVVQTTAVCRRRRQILPPSVALLPRLNLRSIPGGQSLEPACRDPE